MNRLRVVAVAGVAVLGLAVWGVMRWMPEPARLPEQMVPPEPQPAGPPPEPVGPRVLPPLDESDDAVRGWVAEVVRAPVVERWLRTDELVRKFVAAVDNVSRGESPRVHLASLDPGAGFLAKEEVDRTVLDPAGYARYRPAVAAVEAIDSALAVRLFRDLEPLFDEAYRDLGYPAGRFRDTVLAAIDQLLAAPAVDGPILLERRVAAYRFVDPKLEALPAAQKHLVRMGPDATRRIQDKLRLLRRVLAAPSATA